MLVQTDNKLKISIILPVYNGGAYLKKSVESVLQQDEPDFELLIIDDLSSDGSREYLETLTDPRIKLFKNNINKGLFYNLNFLIGHCKTDIIKLWAQDDIMYPHCIRTFFAFHKKNTNISFSYSGRSIIDDKGNILPSAEKDNTPELISHDLHARIAFFTGSIAGNIANVSINKKVFNRVGAFNEDMKISGDFDMWVRLAKAADVGFIQQPLIFLRDHSEQLSRRPEYMLNHVKEDIEVYKNLLSDLPGNFKKEGIKILRKYKFVFYYTLMLKSLLKGNLKTAKDYYKQIKPYTNFFTQTLYFLRSKTLGFPKPVFLNFPERLS